jgi:serine/threonine-protein kinase
MRLHPLHPAAWVLEQVSDAGWDVRDLLAFTRASTLVLASRNGQPPVVLKAGFGSNHVLAELDDEARQAAYGFYWYAEMTTAERALARDDFRHEAALARAASGIPGVVPLLEEGSLDRFDWYTMPWYPGGSFRHLLSAPHSGGSQPGPEGIAILAGVADGLAGLHEHGIIHRDVYQENILISDGTGLITDLGAARIEGSPRGPSWRGPEVHWPPEYAHSYSTATPAADVFSLAVLTYRYLCRDIPRYGQSRLPAAPAALRPVLTAALDAEPVARPPMADFRDALQSSADTGRLSRTARPSERTPQ